MEYNSESTSKGLTFWVEPIHFYDAKHPFIEEYGRSNYNAMPNSALMAPSRNHKL